MHPSSSLQKKFIIFLETRLMTCCGDSIEIEEPTDSAGMLKCYFGYSIGIGYEKRHKNNRKLHHTSANHCLF